MHRTYTLSCKVGWDAPWILCSTIWLLHGQYDSRTSSKGVAWTHQDIMGYQVAMAAMGTREIRIKLKMSFIVCGQILVKLLGVLVLFKDH